MTAIATIDWFGRWGTSVFSENTAIFILNELPHDKTNKMTVCPVKTQISLGIHPV